MRRVPAELVTVCKGSMLPERLSVSAVEAQNNNRNIPVGKSKQKQNLKELNNSTIIKTQQRT